MSLLLKTCRNCQRCSIHCFKEPECGPRRGGEPERCLTCSGAVVIVFDPKRPHGNKGVFRGLNRKARPRTAFRPETGTDATPSQEGAL